MMNPLPPFTPLRRTLMTMSTGTTTIMIMETTNTSTPTLWRINPPGSFPGWAPLWG